MFAIPVYLNIHLTVAISVFNFHQESFDTWFKQVDEIVRSFPEEDIKVCEGIVLVCKNSTSSLKWEIQN